MESASLKPLSVPCRLTPSLKTPSQSKTRARTTSRRFDSVVTSVRNVPPSSRNRAAGPESFRLALCLEMFLTKKSEFYEVLDIQHPRRLDAVDDDDAVDFKLLEELHGFIQQRVAT